MNAFVFESELWRWRCGGLCLSGELPPARSHGSAGGRGGSRGPHRPQQETQEKRKGKAFKFVYIPPRVRPAPGPRAAVPSGGRASTRPAGSRPPRAARAPGRTFRPLSSKLRRRLSPTIITNRIKSETEAILRSGREAPDDCSSLRPAPASVSAPAGRLRPSAPVVARPAPGLVPAALPTPTTMRGGVSNRVDFGRTARADRSGACAGVPHSRRVCAHRHTGQKGGEG